MSKLVLCVKTEEIKPQAGFQWLKNIPEKRRPSALPLDRLWLVPRDAAETDESFLQIIPYVLIFDPTTSSPKILSYWRKGTEERLHDKRSIGIGGHIDTDDLGDLLSPIGSSCSELVALYLTLDPSMMGASIMQVLRTAAVREIREEIGETYAKHAEVNVWPVGMLFDPTEAVGRVHLGVVYTLPVDVDLPVESDEVINPQFLTISQLKQHGELEKWAEYTLDALIDQQPLPAHPTWLGRKTDQANAEIQRQAQILANLKLAKSFVS